MHFNGKNVHGWLKAWQAERARFITSDGNLVDSSVLFSSAFWTWYAALGSRMPLRELIPDWHERRALIADAQQFVGYELSDELRRLDWTKAAAARPAHSSH